MPNDLKPSAYARQDDLVEPDDCLFVSRYQYDKTGYSVPLYAIPEGCVVVPREVLERAADMLSAQDYGKCGIMADELRAILAQQGQEVGG